MASSSSFVSGGKMKKGHHLQYRRHHHHLDHLQGVLQRCHLCSPTRVARTKAQSGGGEGHKGSRFHFIQKGKNNQKGLKRGRGEAGWTSGSGDNNSLGRGEREREHSVSTASSLVRQPDPLKTVQEILDGRREDFVLSAEEVENLMKKNEGLFTDKTHLMRLLVENTGHLSLPPISKFRVSSAALGASGAIYVGVNVEFAGLPLPCSLHAEQFLILNALQHGETHLEKVYISHLPCGHCRQFMCELSKSEKMDIYIVGMEGSFSLPELLPHRFTPRDLLGESAYFLFEEHHNKLFWSAESEKLLAEMKKKNNNNERTQMHEMAVKALAEANSSYAQYSQCPSGICISDHEGNLYSGGLVESAAYNPTVSPLHAALVNGLTNGLKGWKEINQILLVESAEASVKHEHMVKEVVKYICPQATFSVLYAENQASSSSSSLSSA